MATGISFQTTGDFLGKCLIHLQIFMGFFRPKIWSSEKKNLFGGANGYAGGPGLQGHLLHLSESIGIYRIIASFPNRKCAALCRRAQLAPGPFLAAPGPPPFGAGRRNGTTLGRCDTRITGRMSDGHILVVDEEKLEALKHALAWSFLKCAPQHDEV